MSPAQEFRASSKGCHQVDSRWYTFARYYVDPSQYSSAPCLAPCGGRRRWWWFCDWFYSDLDERREKL